MTSDYPEPIIILPQSTLHKQTFILLHGRGSSGEKFGPALLETAVLPNSAPDQPSPSSQQKTLASVFPHARFVFPTAARRRATIYKRAYTHQWFDNWKLDPPATEREELQNAGLRETTAYLHQLLKHEISLVPGGGKNVVLGGLSQGCAAALTALLLWEGEAIGAAFGMCGWLPHAYRMCEQLAMARDEQDGVADEGDAFDPFQRDDSSDGDDTESGDEMSPTAQARAWLREEIGIPNTIGTQDTAVCLDIPLFLGHGVEDDRVSVDLAHLSFRFLKDLGAQVQWEEYEGLGHWYSPHMLGDIVKFIQIHAGW